MIARQPLEQTPPEFLSIDVVKLAVPAFIILIIAEAVYGRISGKATYEPRDTAASLLMGVGNLVVKILAAGLFAGIGIWLYQHRLFNIRYTWWALVLAFFAEDLAYYWFHRVAHERRWFWASHVVHHSSQHYNLSTALRQTWTGRVSFSFIFSLPLFYLGIPPAMIIFFGGVSLVYQFWIHTEAIDRMGPIEWIFNTPSHHRVHHATNPKYLDSNYAGVLIIWDRMFGTFVPEDRADAPDAETINYGIVTNLGTFNPIRIAFHEWVGIARDVLNAKSVGEVIGYVLGPPGWSPDESRKTSKSLKAEWRARKASEQQKQDPQEVAAE